MGGMAELLDASAPRNFQPDSRVTPVLSDETESAGLGEHDNLIVGLVIDPLQSRRAGKH